MKSASSQSILDKIFSWARANSIGYFTVGGACCADEVLNASACRYDLERFGAVEQSDPKQADLLIICGVLNGKMKVEVKAVYDSMASPKYVIAVGTCANGGGLFSQEGANATVPVDVYVAGCPPRPEAIMNGIIALQDKILGRQHPSLEN